ncbi:unnamed protein product [Urochloa humidicola]
MSSSSNGATVMPLPANPPQASNDEGTNKHQEDSDKTKKDVPAVTTTPETQKSPVVPDSNVQRLAIISDERDNKGNLAAEKVLSVSANLAKLLPSGAVLVYQTLSASFTNQGSCNTANKWLSALLVGFLSAACIFLTFTDSIVDKHNSNKIYYGVALPQRLKLFALSPREEKRLLRSLKKELVERRLKTLDWVHAFFTAIVFLSIAMGDVGLQKCFFPDLDSDHMKNVKELLRNAPLGLALLSSFVFMIFPTTRRGVGFDNGGDRRPTTADDEQQKKDDPTQGADKTKSGDLESQMNYSNTQK